MTTDLFDDLDSFGRDPGPDVPEGTVTVLADESAAWEWMRRLVGVRAKRARISRLAQAEIDRVGAWATAKDGPLAESEAHLTAALEDYALRRRQDTGGKVKSVDTPYGRIETSTSPGGWERADEVALLSFVERWLPDAVRVPPTPSPKVDLPTLKRAAQAQDDGSVVFLATGEVVPGVKALPGSVTATVKIVDDEETPR